MDYLVSPEAIEFLTFTTELYEELGSQRYCAEVSDSNGNRDSILSLTCEKFDIPILSICGELKPDHESPILGMWQLPLTREKIKEHVTPSHSAEHALLSLIVSPPLAVRRGAQYLSQ
jgi:hypothetical protein